MSSTVFPKISEGGSGVRAGVVVRDPSVPAVEVTRVEAGVLSAAVVVVGLWVLVAAGPTVGNVLKLNAPVLPDAIAKPVLGVVIAETAELGPADVLEGTLRLNPPSKLETGVGDEKEVPPKEAGVDT